MIDSAPPQLVAKIEAAKNQGGTFIVIDTPPHADSAATRAVDVADLVLIPCRPSAFDLAAIRATVQLVKVLGKPAAVIFTAGPTHAPRLYQEATEFIHGAGVPVCPHMIPDRAIYRHASAAGQTVIEVDPDGKAACEIARLHSWTCAQVHVGTPAPAEGNRT